MKKNKMMRIASVLLVAVLLSTCAISGTFAKFTTSANLESDKATVATWSIKVAGSDIVPTGSAQTVTVDLFKTAYELTADGKVGDTEDAQIKTAGNIIAPGCGGKLQFTVENASDVDATYAIDFTYTGSIPLQFSTNNTTWADSITDISATALAMGDSTTVTLYWKWDFNATGNDNAHAGVTNVTVSAKIDVNQAD